MRVLCCAVEFWPETHRALHRYAPQAEAVKIMPGSWNGYGKELFSRWGKGDLLVVEQDNVIHESVIPQLEDCPEPWCAFPYRHPSCGDDGWLVTGLGCTRFRLEFQQKVTVSEIASEGGNCDKCFGLPGKHECWVHLDGRIGEAGERLGFKRHLHWPSAGHRDVPPGETGS